MKDLYGNEIEPGCHVRLTCGSIVMVVDSVGGRDTTTGVSPVWCEWEENGTLHEGSFSPHMLEVVSSIEDLREDYER